MFFSLLSAGSRPCHLMVKYIHEHVQHEYISLWSNGACFTPELGCCLFQKSRGQQRVKINQRDVNFCQSGNPCHRMLLCATCRCVNSLRGRTRAPPHATNYSVGCLRNCVLLVHFAVWILPELHKPLAIWIAFLARIDSGV